MGAPVLMGAGVGALASLATGRDPFQGAALGGLTGGAFGGSAGFGSGFTEGGMFNLGSELGAQAGTLSTPAASTTFGASQSPSALLSSQSAIQPSTTSSLLGGEAALPQYNVGMGGVSGSPQGFTGDIYSGAIQTPEYINPALTSDPNKLSQSFETGSGTFTDGIADQFRPKFEETTAVSSADKAAQTGGYEKPLFERAYEGMSTYIKENPLVAAQLGVTALSGISPPEKEGPTPTAISGSVSKGTPPSTPSQPLRIRRPQ